MIELELHEQIEDEIFYPAVQDISTLVPLGHAEHRQLGDQLAVLLRTDPCGADFIGQLELLRALLEHHGGLEEEGRMFPEVAARVDPATLSELGKRLESRLQHLRHSRIVASELVADIDALSDGTARSSVLLAIRIDGDRSRVGLSDPISGISCCACPSH